MYDLHRQAGSEITAAGEWNPLVEAATRTVSGPNVRGNNVGTCIPIAPASSVTPSKCRNLWTYDVIRQTWDVETGNHISLFPTAGINLSWRTTPAAAGYGATSAEIGIRNPYYETTPYVAPLFADYPLTVTKAGTLAFIFEYSLQPGTGWDASYNLKTTDDLHEVTVPNLSPVHCRLSFDAMGDYGGAYIFPTSQTSYLRVGLGLIVTGHLVVVGTFPVGATIRTEISVPYNGELFIITDPRFPSVGNVNLESASMTVIRFNDAA